MEMPLSEIIDRYTILKLKMKAMDDLFPEQVAKEKPRLEREFIVYEEAIDKYRKNGIDVGAEMIQELYEINAKCWDMENNMRRNMDRVSSLSPKELEEVGRSAVKMLNFNEGRTALKKEIKEKYKTIVNVMEMPLAEIIDRYAILRLKKERVGSLTSHQILHEKPLLEIEFALYSQAIDEHRQRGTKVEDEWITKLYEVNAKCWDIESDIRQGKGESLGLGEVGKTVMVLREVHKGRIGLKNEIAEKTKIGFKEVKFIK